MKITGMSRACWLCFELFEKLERIGVGQVGVDQDEVGSCRHDGFDGVRVLPVLSTT